MNPSWPSCTTMPDNFRSLRKYLGSRSSDIPRAKSAKLAKIQNLFCFLCGLCVLCARYSEIWLRLCRAVRSVVRAYFLVDSTNLRSGRRCRPTSAATISAARVLREQQIDKPTVFSASGRPNNAAREVAQISPYPLLEILVARAMVLAPLQ
jgi:hypothetical protein